MAERTANYTHLMLQPRFADSIANIYASRSIQLSMPLKTSSSDY